LITYLKSFFLYVYEKKNEIMSVGLDIGSKTIKIVELAQEGAKWRLKASGIVGYKGLAPDIAKDDKELSELVDAVKKLHKEAKIGSREVGIALSESSIYTRTVKFPLLTDAEIASAVRWEAEQYIPIPIAEAVIQHQIIERHENTTPASVDVLLVAAPRIVVERYVRAVEMAGLNLVSVETELISLSRSLGVDGQAVLVADLGARSTDIAIVKNSKLAFSRSFATGGDAFTRAVSQFLGIDQMQAEEYKRTYGLRSDQLEGKVKQSLESVFHLVGDEMKKALHYYQSESKGEQINSVVLSGGAAGLPDVTATLTKHLGIEVIIGNPFAKVEVDQSAISGLTGYAPFYAVAVGLAMRPK
jgi:type IV pilus assembly protein PilM